MKEMRTPVLGVGTPDDRYAMWDAAYVLGSLSAAERREFETHMVQCPACREAVADLSGVPALLSQPSREDVAGIDTRGAELPEPPEMSPQLLPALLATVRWRRRRTRMVTWVASAAAAVVLGLGVFAGVQGYVTQPPQHLPQAASQQMSQVGTNLLTSSVAVTSQHWGTSINLSCVCLAPLNAHHDTLALVVVGRDGSQTRLATWVAVPGHTATPAASISTPVDQIAAVQVVGADNGQVLLQRSL
ncbi:hypothetical protein A5714_19605 [Mycobacterium sp. E2462]|uniref:anti-sigma factor family protein n=1 Tax=Mycobacterium sp. E2462 TaxID=1834133 RepID=UPI0007FBB5D4|nr:zf-HC2 domain-containing protein [Mycobacterium sp. E2462]OBI09466.1 hypothetical protein A5714_19605 [Mycobacterium sp. E2462]